MTLRDVAAGTTSGGSSSSRSPVRSIAFSPIGGIAITLLGSLLAAQIACGLARPFRNPSLRLADASRPQEAKAIRDEATEAEAECRRRGWLLPS